MAAKFVFRLEPLLELRRRLELQQQREFVGCRRDLEECRAEIARLAGARQRYARELVESARMPMANLRLREAHLRFLDAAIDAQRRRLMELERAREASRGALIAANRERRVIEKLKQRRLRAFEAEEARRDEQERDDANARRRERALRERRAAGPSERAEP
jgi:flagellar protein FliJ